MQKYLNESKTPSIYKKHWAEMERQQIYLRRKYIHPLRVQEIIHPVYNEYRNTTVWMKW